MEIISFQSHNVKQLIVILMKSLDFNKINQIIQLCNLRPVVSKSYDLNQIVLIKLFRSMNKNHLT